MNLRNELEPKLEIAEKYYPRVLDLILKYTEYCDDNNDEEFIEYKKLGNALQSFTGKDISKYNLWEWWEEEGAEVLAFRISLPEAEIIENISREELSEIIKRITSFEEPDENDNSFKSQFHYYLNDYYHDLLKINFKNYQADLFDRQKDNNGNYYEYSNEELTKRIWGNKE
jgi:hypothetical protein